MLLNHPTIPKLQIGSLTLDLPVVQAALSGYSDWPMRTLARSFGAPYTICEVMLDHFVASLRDRERTRRFLMLTDADHPAGAQLMGADPAEFPEAARRLVKAGFDAIDINFGCPVKKVLGRCRGGFHLGQPETALEIVRRVRDTVPDHIPVTLKMRRGVDDSQGSRDKFFEILEGAFAGGITAVTVHGRTVEQRYIGPSDWEFLKEICSTWPDRTILGSGDLFCAEDCVRMIHETGVHGVTAARGSIGNPWIFGQCRELLAGRPLPPPPSVHDQRDALLQHFDFTDRVYPSGKAYRQMRKFGLRYADWHPHGGRVRADFIKVGSNESWLEVLDKWYRADQPGQYPENPGRPKPPAG
ncbi:MAG: tRNA-dihydrouridine synthase family protein [Fuerstiella sp.]|nr:tRNA-dihydrouridine synthase family protein [Fuerstiella sp.]